ncbi:hypothetical protein L3Q82_014002 [Scortum barcoo]|uniref:Uncharacterized protein n=1 Tax=Scortum barcoo TaxID=214431 RepID=A0ACB8VVZ0_9TELE|nr:hypothetical protein L3Q82_014002 [Scortum barcoo]
MLSHEDLQNASVLILANKQDVKGSMTAAEISQCLTLDSITTHSWHVQACCALTGEGCHVIPDFKMKFKLLGLGFKMHQLAQKEDASAYVITTRNDQHDKLTRCSLFRTDNWYSVISGQHKESTGGDSHPHRALRSSSGHARITRAAPGGGVTINTLPDNMTRVVEDSGKYYTWRSFGPEDQRTQDLWVDMSDVRHGQVRAHGILSNSYKQAVKVALSFDFPFYGHYLRQITIATGGFIFTEDITHRMLTATQYIAPLMANFDPSYSKDSTVQYLDNGEVFVVQWERVRLPGKESEGAFTFQAALYRTGTITFSYRDIPLSLDVISSVEHPVKVGLSDAFMVTSPSTQSPEAQWRTIFEYHRVEIDTTKITSYSAVEFTALPTCLQHNSCELCLSSNQTSGCSWCNVLQRCSDGMDRHRQEWLDYACSEESKDATCEDYSRGDSSSASSIAPEIEAVTSLTPLQKGCQSDGEAELFFYETKRHIFKTGSDVKTDSSTKSDGLANTGVIAGIAAALVLLLALILVALYINYHPTAASPLYLIQRRKSYWPSLKFQKQQPGYTEVGGEAFSSNPPSLDPSLNPRATDQPSAKREKGEGGERVGGWLGGREKRVVRERSVEQEDDGILHSRLLPVSKLQRVKSVVGLWPQVMEQQPFHGLHHVRRQGDRPEVIQLTRMWFLGDWNDAGCLPQLGNPPLSQAQFWHKRCFSCEVCKMTLNMKNYKGFDKRPYCNSHYPKTNFTCVADTPENLRLKQQSKMQSQVLYREDFEKNKGKGFSVVVDTPELQRIKKTQDQISNIKYHEEFEKKKVGGEGAQYQPSSPSPGYQQPASSQNFNYEPPAEPVRQAARRSRSLLWGKSSNAPPHPNLPGPQVPFRPNTIRCKETALIVVNCSVLQYWVQPLK